MVKLEESKMSEEVHWERLFYKDGTLECEIRYVDDKCKFRPEN